MSESLSSESRTWEEYFSVASRYGGGQSMRSVGTTLKVIPRWTRHNTPGETKSLTLSAFCQLMKSPGLTSAAACPPKNSKPAPIARARARGLQKTYLSELCIPTPPDRYELVRLVSDIR